MTAVLEAKNVTKIFGGGFLSREEENVAVNNISMTLDQKNPKIIAVAGESGSGKTTLARLLLGIASPSTGTVEYDGKDLSDISRSERREFRREVQPIFQDPSGHIIHFTKWIMCFSLLLTISKWLNLVMKLLIWLKKH